jgi:CRISPR system Cascade subunit CasE
MPYLSRIHLNPLRTGAQRLLSNPQRMHAAVLGGLSKQPVEERVLWRPERDGEHRASVLVLTQSTPSWEHLVEQAGWSASDDAQALVRSYEPVLDRIERGREFRFRLRANPVSATRSPVKPSPEQQRHLQASARPRGVRVAHRTAAHQLDWLKNRIGAWGFALRADDRGGDAVRLTERERMSFPKAGGHRVVIQTATYEGVLCVEDAERARASLVDGVGAGRAYGCGLITLAPA